MERVGFLLTSLYFPVLSIVDSTPHASSSLRPGGFARSRAPYVKSFVCHTSESACKQTTLTPAFATLTKDASNCTKIVQINPLESALTDGTSVTLLESALTKN